jgi:hypothetical protein
LIAHPIEQTRRSDTAILGVTLFRRVSDASFRTVVLGVHALAGPLLVM